MTSSWLLVSFRRPTCLLAFGVIGRGAQHAAGDRSMMVWHPRHHRANCMEEASQHPTHSIKRRMTLPSPARSGAAPGPSVLNLTTRCWRARYVAPPGRVPAHTPAHAPSCSTPPAGTLMRLPSDGYSSTDVAGWDRFAKHLLPLGRETEGEATSWSRLSVGFRAAAPGSVLQRKAW